VERTCLKFAKPTGIGREQTQKKREQGRKGSWGVPGTGRVAVYKKVKRKITPMEAGNCVTGKKSTGAALTGGERGKGAS